jgi:hypothetical protein
MSRKKFILVFLSVILLVASPVLGADKIRIQLCQSQRRVGGL